MQIYRGSHCIYGAQYGKSLDDSSLSTILQKLQQDLLMNGPDAPDLTLFDYFKFRVSAINIPEDNVLIIIITDVTDLENRIKPLLNFFKNEFLKLFGLKFERELNNQDIDTINNIIEKLQKGLFPKISFVGYSGVGKTTLTRLMLGAEIPREHIPTITGTINMIQVGSIYLNIWDEAGQEQFQFVWSKLLQGSDVIFIVTDSTVENVEKSKYFADLAKVDAPHARVAVIANKQDLPGAISALDIKQKLGDIRTFSMVASDPASRQKIFNIISDILEILPQDVHSSQILLERDQLQESLNVAIRNKDTVNAFRTCTRLETIYEEMGDEGTASEYCSKKLQFQSAVSSTTKVQDLNKSASSIHLTLPVNKFPQTSSEPKISGPILPPKSETGGTFSLMQTPKLTQTPPQKKQVYETIWNLNLKKLNLDKHLKNLEKQAAVGELPLETFNAMKQKAIQMAQEIDREITHFKDLLQQYNSIPK